MTPEREKILDKIKKCMALASGGNEHEAAAALRQAQALMAAHGISDAERVAIGVSDKRSRAGAVETPAKWECGLAGQIAHAFGCRLLFVREDWYTASWSFIGVEPSNTIAQYAFEVLARQARKARSNHMKTALKRYKRSNKSRHGDLFCEGWVQSAMRLVGAPATSAATKEQLDAFMAVHHPDVSKLAMRDRNAGRELSNRELDSYASGRSAGRDATLRRGVGAEAPPLAIESRGG